MVESPELWNSFKSFQEAKRFVCNVKVLNDAAERNVKFYSESSCILTADPEQRAS